MGLAPLYAIQAISIALILFVGLDYFFTIIFSGKKAVKTKETNFSPLLIIMPFRNESSTLPKSMPPVLEYIKSDNDSRLILIDSASNDNSIAIANELISNHYPIEPEPVIISSSSGGKCAALNAAMEKRNNGEQILIVDSDAILTSSGINSLRAALIDKSIGSVSGLEKIRHDSNTLSRVYKSKLNKSRASRSQYGSTIILEGSMLMFDPDRIGWRLFNEEINADDAQISSSSILSGHRSIVSIEAEFIQIPQLKSFSLSQSVRRGQGLVSVLVKNPRLFITKGMFRETLRTWLLYVVVPWCTASLVFTSGFFLLLRPGGIVSGPIEYSNMAFLIFIIFSRFGRTLALGSLSMIVAHFRIITGKSYKSWRPIR